MTIKDKVLNMKVGAWNSSLEGDINKDDPADLQYLAAITAQAEIQGALATRRSLKQEYSKTLTKSFSPMVPAFLVAADGRISTTEISMDVAPVLKAYDVVIVKADGVSFLHYKLVEKYHGSVSLKDMLKDNSFQAEYNKTK